MIERLIENWLASSGERGYEVPFAQLLASEGHRVIQGPVHHPLEHGKDILTFAANGELHAYQLKGPDLVNLGDFEKIQGQLLALAGTAITHPAVTPARRADRVFLVTNATLTTTVRDRIEKFNTSTVPSGWPLIEPVERDQLLIRFVAAHGKYLPQSLPDIRKLLELYYSDPASLFPVKLFAGYLSAILPFPPQDASIPACRQAIASVTLLTAYAVASWTRSENHLCVAQAWLTACITLMRFAAVRTLNTQLWLGSYELALEAARVALASLSKEAAQAEDLVVPDLVDGLIYPSRALLVSGFLGAYLLSERTLGDVDKSVDGTRSNDPHTGGVACEDRRRERRSSVHDNGLRPGTARPDSDGRRNDAIPCSRSVKAESATLGRGPRRSLPRHGTGPLATAWCGQRS